MKRTMITVKTDVYICLLEKAIHRYKIQLNKTKDKFSAIRYSFSRALCLPKADFRFSMLYFWIVDPLITDQLEKRIPAQELSEYQKILMESGNEDKKAEVLKELQQQLTFIQLYNNYIAIRDDKVEEVNLDEVLWNVLIAYTTEIQTITQIYSCYYYSTKADKIKTFILEANGNDVTIKNFHGKKSNIYYTGKIRTVGNNFYITTYRNSNINDHQLILNLSGYTTQFDQLNYTAGTFLASALRYNIPISSELFLVKQNILPAKQIKGAKAHTKDGSRHIRQHLNLQRNRIKAFDGQSIISREYYNKFFYELKSLEKLIGTFLIGRKNKRGDVIVSVLRIYDDFRITLEHPYFDGIKTEVLNCQMKITTARTNTMFLLDVLHHQEPNGVFIAALVDISTDKNEKRATYQGSFVGMGDNTGNTVEGKIILHQLNTNPKFSGEITQPKKLKATRHFHDYPYNLLYKYLTKDEDEENKET